MTSKPYITRIAPSPTGDAHLGTFRTAYFNWLAARATGGKFILRIDDTDQERSKKEFVLVITETLEWLGLDYDEIIYQSDRFEHYKKMAKTLVELDCGIVLNNGAIALKDKSKLFPSLNEILPKTWDDEVNGKIPITDHDKEQIDGMILIKGDGSPTYNWASVIDDYDFGINYVIRGKDHISNTSKQIAFWCALGSQLLMPKFAHIGLIHMNKKKLSKRDGAASMLYYREKGYDPDAMLNLMIRLGWGPTIDDKTTKIITKEQAIELFLEGGKMRSSDSNIDLNMLEAFDRKYKAQKGVWRTKETLIKK